MVEMILNRIANPDQVPQRITVPTELIKHDSCREYSASDRPALVHTTENAERR